MTNIPISGKHGVNPCMEICAQCDKETGVILLAGKTHKWKCCSCGRISYGRKPEIKCRCGADLHQYEIVERDVEMPRHVATGNICGDCKKKDEEMVAAVQEGGIYWRCRDCGSYGAIKKDAPIAAKVREDLKTPAPKPCAIEFTKESLCPVCGPHKIEPPAPPAPPSPADGPK